MQIKCVTGAPGSGKSTYVKEHIGENDIVFDYDNVAQAVTGKDPHAELTEGQTHVCRYLRYSVLDASKAAENIDVMWMISSKPDDTLKERLGEDCEYINLDVTEEEALDRVDKDPNRPDKEGEEEKVHKYFEEDRSEMIRDNREYRSMPMLVEKVAEDEERKYVVEGYASTFDEYELFNDGENTFCERIEPTAFDETDMTDVVFLLDHEGRVYARTRNGSVQLMHDDRGLYSRVDLSRSTSARQVLEDIECGNYDRMSFAFTVKDDEIIHDSAAGKYTRVIKRVGKLFDISAVSFPANPNTEIGVSMRSAFDGFIEEEKRLELAKAEEARKLAEWKTKMKEIQNGNL